MNYILLSSKFGKETCRLIQSKMVQDVSLLIKDSNERIWKQNKNERARIVRDQIQWNSQEDNVINWANSINISNIIPKLLNKNEACSTTSNKKETRRILQEANIPVPKSWFNINDVPLQPFIARPEKHYGGNEFYVIEKYEDYRQLHYVINDPIAYYQEIFPKTNEYRVHCAHGKILAINEKPIPTNGEIRANHTVNEEAWTYVPWENYDITCCKACLDACKEIGLDYGAVDIMYDSVASKWAICEINTSPALSDYTSSRYAKYFDWILAVPTSEHWNYSEYTRGKSFAWKESHFNTTHQL